MFNHRHYVPILKWKMGEYQALQRLASTVKDRVTPLLEIPPVGFDFENLKDKKTPDEHLSDFVRRLKSKWQDRPCFVDLKYLPPETRMVNGSHYVDAVFTAAREERCLTIPVICFANDDAFLDAVAVEVFTERRGVCLRLALADFDRPALFADVEKLLGRFALSWADADLVIDLGTPNFLPINAYTRTLSMLLSMVPALNRWRTLTIAATAYPQSVAAVTKPFQKLPRHEWVAYRAFIATLGREARVPTFGDYAVAHPDLVELDMRLVKPFAKLRYTTDDAWHVGRGTPVRTHGFGQYREMCAELLRQSYFSGAPYSAGDAHIADCAAGKIPTGNLSTWVWVSTNRHLTKAVDDIATLHGLSIAAE